MAKARPGRTLLGRLSRAAIWFAAALAAVFLVLLVLDTVAPPVSTLMMARLATGRNYERDYVPLSAIAPVAVASVISSEDARFCVNDGVDWGALHEVLSEAEDYSPLRGASTITMQTAKNLFLWSSRSAVRKGVEIGIAMVLGKIWSKPHTIEVYLNIAEWGDGIFGIEAASRRYFGKHASALDAQEAALLATALPNPYKRDPAHPRVFQRRLAAALMARTRGSAQWLGCLPRR